MSDVPWQAAVRKTEGRQSRPPTGSPTLGTRCRLAAVDGSKKLQLNKLDSIHPAGHFQFRWLIQRATGVFVTSTRQVMSVIYVDEAIKKKKKKRALYITARQAVE